MSEAVPKVPDNFIALILGPKNQVIISPRCQLPRNGIVLDANQVREARVIAEQFALMAGVRVMVKINGKRDVYRPKGDKEP